jgi:hypothetical protein
LGDTLRVEGVKVFEHFAGYSYAECVIDGERIDVMVKRFYQVDVIQKSPYIFDVKIPGFKAGTYQVGIPGCEYVTLECKGTPTQIENVKSEIKNGTTIYDLSGRKMVNGKLPNGLYIVNGKVMVGK